MEVRFLKEVMGRSWEEVLAIEPPEAIILPD